MSNLYLNSESTDLPSHEYSTIKDKQPNFHRTSLRSWTKIEPNPENSRKYSQKLMRPLQVNQKRGFLVLVDPKAPPKETGNDEGKSEKCTYNKMISKIKEINQIMAFEHKLAAVRNSCKENETIMINQHNTIKSNQNTPKSSQKQMNSCPDEDILEKNLSRSIFGRVKLAREASINQSIGLVPEQDTTIVVEEATVGNEAEIRHKRLATQLSSIYNSNDKRLTAKQLNSNAHFRHAKRKILLLRSLDANVNRKETMIELMASVQTEFKPKLKTATSFSFTTKLGRQESTENNSEYDLTDSFGVDKLQNSVKKRSNYIRAATISILDINKEDSDKTMPTLALNTLKSIKSMQSCEIYDTDFENFERARPVETLNQLEERAECFVFERTTSEKVDINETKSPRKVSFWPNKTVSSGVCGTLESLCDIDDLVINMKLPQFRLARGNSFDMDDVGVTLQAQLAAARDVSKERDEKKQMERCLNSYVGQSNKGKLKAELMGNLREDLIKRCDSKMGGNNGAGYGGNVKLRKSGKSGSLKHVRITTENKYSGEFEGALRKISSMANTTKDMSNKNKKISIKKANIGGQDEKYGL